jgi:2-keto-3-deoxy-L-rhamnonate aldolase RhmA
MASIKARPALTLLFSLGLLTCAPADSSPGESGASEVAPTAGNRLIELLEAGLPVFGLVSGEKTPESGATMGRTLLTDYVFYSLESGPFDMLAMEAYITGMTEAAGTAGAHPVMLRIPPIRVDREAAVEHVRAGLDAGAVAIAFPHLESAEDVQLAASAIGDRLWPANPNGDVLNIVMIEDQAAVEAVREIVRTPGVSVVLPGPGDLSTAYDGDAEAVENAIQTVLLACKEFNIPCMITGNSDDVADRLEQGFELFLLTEPSALATGLAAAGRSN